MDKSASLKYYYQNKAKIDARVTVYMRHKYNTDEEYRLNKLNSMKQYRDRINQDDVLREERRNYQKEYQKIYREAKREKKRNIN